MLSIEHFANFSFATFSSIAESDSAARDSDCSEGLADSVATCLPGGGSTSQCTSTEIISGSADLLSQKGAASDRDNTFACPSPKVIPRTKRRNSERPWSVSCLSQLTQRSATTRSTEQIANQGLANHSISESALHKLNTSANNHNGSIRSSDSRNSLKRRRMRLKKKQRSESGSNNSDSSHRRSSIINISKLTKSESFSGSILTEETSSTTIFGTEDSNSSQIVTASTVTSEMESEEDLLQKPNFQLGAYASNAFFTHSATKLGALAPLGYYTVEPVVGMAPVREPSYTGTEDNSNQSEQAWDDYQEKYMSEAYSEGRDSDAARKLLDFGDDYRKYLDSQSDCCSSLSAANNLDSMSPPRNRKMLPVNSALPIGSNSLNRRRNLVEGSGRFIIEGKDIFSHQVNCH